MLNLHSLVSLVKNRKRVGRGGSRGGTSGRGGKGQTARSGGSIRPGFEGGQMPLHRRLPKRGFTNQPFRDEVIIVNLVDLERVCSVDAYVDRNYMITKGLVKDKNSEYAMIKVLGNGVLTKKITVCANMFSRSAIEAIKKVGGEVVYRSKGE